MLLSPGLGIWRGHTELLVSSRRNGVSAGVFSFFFCCNRRNVNNIRCHGLKIVRDDQRCCESFSENPALCVLFDLGATMASTV